MILGILKEEGNENRVSITPDCIAALQKIGLSILVEKDAGIKASFSDADYANLGVKVCSRNELIAEATLLTCYGIPNGNFSGKILLGQFQPVYNFKKMKELGVDQKNSVLSLDAIPRITRAQSMDILSSQATVAGYKAVLLAASHLTRFFPMLTTAAGTITAAKVLVIGAGVAGLQAVATSRRLGAVVEVFDTRPEVKEQVMSLGGKFIEVEGAAVGANTGGYAVEQTEEYKKKQSDAIAKSVKEASVVITTALIPGKKAPVLVTHQMVSEMRKGSVVVDMATAMGGNVEGSEDNKTVQTQNSVTIIGNSNLASTIPGDASKMYSKNILNFLNLFVKDKNFHWNFEDEIIKGVVITHNGEILHAGTKQAQG